MGERFQYLSWKMLVHIQIENIYKKVFFIPVDECGTLQSSYILT